MFLLSDLHDSMVNATVNFAGDTNLEWLAFLHRKIKCPCVLEECSEE